MNKKNKKVIIIVNCIVIVLLLTCLFIVVNKHVNSNAKIENEKRAELDDEGIISINVKINSETSTEYKCLLTFT